MPIKEDISRFVIEPQIEKAIESLSISVNEHGFDTWGLSLDECKLYYSIGYRLYRYFRPEIYGIENLPKGRVLIVPNHSGQLPYDGLVVAVACLLKSTPPKLLRPMVERFATRLPFINEIFSRSGVVLGDPINCKNLLESDNAILVFPEGARGSGKIWKNRYKLEPFGRGFMRLALQTKTPIVPVAVVGAEESIVSVYNWKKLAKILNFPYVPVSPLLPFAGLFAYFPLPVKFHIHFGKPLYFDGPYDDEDPIIDQKVKQVSDEIQKLIDEGRSSRTSLFF